MAISKYNLIKWYKMLSGKSVLHVNQDIGKIFSTTEIKGYYNNLTEKVTMQPELLGSNQLPMLHTENNKDVFFPVAIFQYALGSYDLYLQKGDNIYREKFLQCADWAITNQNKNGSWNNFFYIYPKNPYGAMAQGEGASVLIRAYEITKEKLYLTAAHNAINFMLTPIKDGGTTQYEENGDIIFMEYTHLPCVLNGWIFAWFGLYDFVLATNNNGKYKELMEHSCLSIIKMLPKFQNFYWSLYSLDGKLASPFYHNLHIAQMQAMYIITGYEQFHFFANLWKQKQGNKIYKASAFMKKALQKIRE